MQPDLREIVAVPNKRIKRLVELGLHVERAQHLKAWHRRAQKLARRRNRREH